MTDQLHTNETPRGLLGFLGKIAGPNGFFGPGFWADFKEGWSNDTKASAQEDCIHVNDDSDLNPFLSPSVGNTEFNNGGSLFHGGSLFGYGFFDEEDT